MVAYWFATTRFSIFTGHQGADVNKFFRIFRGLTVASLAFITVSCAGGAGGNSGDPSYVRIDMGMANQGDMFQQTEDTFRRHQYLTFRADQAPVPLLESEWRNQTPFPDEQALGITEVRCRITVRGRERAGGNRNTRMFQVTYQMDVQVKTLTEPEWIDMPLTPERNQMARGIGQELRTLLEVARR